MLIITVKESKSSAVVVSPSGLRVAYPYLYGMLNAMRNADSNALLWQANAINALGQITQSTLGCKYPPQSYSIKMYNKKKF